MNLAFFNQIETHLNRERLDAYRQDGVDEATTLARYLLNMALCESLYSPLQMAEITLRNALHSSLTAKANTAAWYDSISLPAWQQQQITKAKQTLTKHHKTHTPGRIIAEQTFGVWVGFFTRPHMTSGLAYYIAKTAFSYAPKADRDVAKLASRWQKIRDIRNRVFHHERILHWQDLDQRHQDILEVIEWMSPELKNVTTSLDRFATIRKDGLKPWIDQIQKQWPNNS